MGDYLPHTYLQGAWGTCARCYYRYKIDGEMEWQRGKLLCKANCIDKRLLGDREVQIAQVLEDGKSEKELAPVEKLKEPVEYTETEEFPI
jgi:hypothetical protein